jgi:hypothetical protein
VASISRRLAFRAADTPARKAPTSVLLWGEIVDPKDERLKAIASISVVGEPILPTRDIGSKTAIILPRN